MASIRHVDLVVGSLAVSLPFYRELLSLLGGSDEQKVIGEQGETITYLAGSGGFADGAIGLREPPAELVAKPHWRYDLGVHHVAFNAETNQDVDRVADWLIANNVSIESGPEHYYSGNYYAVFFYDPDGIKLEVVCK